MAELAFQLATVLAIDEVAKTVTVQSMEDGQLLPNIPIDNPSYRQYIPAPGQLVLILKLFTNDWRIVAYFGDKSLSKQAAIPIRPGAVMMQGSGNGYFYADASGNVQMSDGSMSNWVQCLVDTQISMLGDGLGINIKGVGQIVMKPANPNDPTSKNSIEITKVNNGIPVAKILIQNDKLVINGPVVEVGPAAVGGAVYSLSNIPGDYTVDSLGRPVPCSGKLKVSP